MNTKNKYNLLIIDADKDILENISNILTLFNYDVTTCSKPQESLEILSSKKFDLIILEILMPTMSAFDLISQSRANNSINSDTSYIFMSGDNSDDNISKSFDFGAIDFFAKPFNMIQFIQRVKNYLKLIDIKIELKQEVETRTKELEKSNTELKYLLYHDSLTSLQNRNALIKTIKTKKEATEVILIDINAFSRINDIHGEKVGDDVLMNVSSALETLAGDNWIVHRISADQFVLLSVKSHSLKFCEQKSALIYDHLDNLSIIATQDKISLDVTISVTIAISKDDEQLHLLDHADMALKYAKRTNHKIIVYSDNLNIEKQYEKDLKAIEMVKKALEEDRLVPFFQPIIKDEDRESFECLVRIIDGDKIISPFFFVDSIKQTKYYIQLTKRMIDKSFEIFKDKNATFSINLSFEDISNSELREYIKSKIIAYEIYDKLILEILESESIDNFDIVRAFLLEVKELGVKIAIDDFGSGYSNFSYIAELQPDFVKVDGSIIKNIVHDEDAYIIAKTIADFSAKMGMKSIAEFIHSDEVYKKAKEIGFFGFQGYELGEPRAII
jgi:diguanylate cyclase (GGDEF)-like protein